MNKFTPTPEDYEILDRYLKTAFQLLEGFTDIERSRCTLSEYLQFHRSRRLPDEFEDFLIRLFFEKCSREFGLQHEDPCC